MAHIENLIVGDAVVDKLPRIFSLFPPIYGQSTWNLDTVALNVSTSAVYTLVPNFSFDANVKMWGAGGASNRLSSANPGNGGGGGYASGKLQFNRGQHYTLVVGEGGHYHIQPIIGVYTIGGGGSSLVSTDCGTGGGMSGLFTGSYVQGNALMIAGGGGAGSTLEIGPYAFNGGAGGGTDADRGRGYNVDTGQGPDNYFGYGGTQTAGGDGAMNNAQAGSALLGGHGNDGNTGAPHGGGGGYFGGGGAGSSANAGHAVAGSAGGGSGFLRSGVVKQGVLSVGSATVPGNPGDAQRGTAGNGGTISSFTTGSVGRVIIY